VWPLIVRRGISGLSYLKSVLLKRVMASEPADGTRESSSLRLVFGR
jgi:hypothetical protein